MIAVVGATGAVGTPAVRALLEAGLGPIRLGGRRLGPLQELASELGGECVAQTVDVMDEESMAAFCFGASLVLHCAAPAFGFGDRIGAAALQAEADYVDLCGEAPVRRGLVERGWAHRAEAEGRRAVISTGVTPGLSGLLPQLVVAGLHAPLQVTGWSGGLEHCSPGVALDMPLSLAVGGADGEGYGTPLAAWRDGRRVRNALTVREHAEAPFFPEPAALQPFLSAEIERVCRALDLDGAEWFNVHPGRLVREQMHALPARLREPDGERLASEALIRAGELDLAGRDPYYVLVVSATGLGADGAPAGMTIALHTPDSYALTGVVGAITAALVLEGAVPAGVHLAHEVLDPRVVLDRVARSGAAAVTEVVGAPDDGAEVGELVEEAL